MPWMLQPRDEESHGLGADLADGLCGLKTLLRLVGLKIVDPRRQTPALPHRLHRAQNDARHPEHGQNGGCDNNEGEPLLSHEGMLAARSSIFNAEKWKVILNRSTSSSVCSGRLGIAEIGHLQAWNRCNMPEFSHLIVLEGA